MTEFANIVVRWWPRFGWAAMVAAYPFEYSALFAVGSVLAMVGHMLGIRRKLRPTHPQH